MEVYRNVLLSQHTGAEGVAQWVGYLPSMHEILALNPSTT